MVKNKKKNDEEKKKKTSVVENHFSTATKGTSVLMPLGKQTLPSLSHLQSKK